MYKGKIAIIGGGIGGVAAAVALLQSGFTVRVFERAAALREAGAGVILWPNATGILQKLEVLPAIVSQGQHSAHFVLRSPSGALLMDISTCAADMPTLGVHRADLLHTLARSLPAECISPEHELMDVQIVGEKIHLRFGNGESFICDGMIGADGIYSRVRTGVLGASRPAYRGYAIFRGLVDAPSAFSLGNNGESWGMGQRFGILAVGKNKICWYATVNVSNPQQLAENRKEKLQQLFRGWHDPIPELIATTDPDAILLNSACDVKTRRFWSREPITLLGDAAHALTPNLGQGACMALEDAFVLSQCLRKCASVNEGFRQYESLRFRHARSAILRSRWLGHVGQWDNRMAVAVRDAVTRLLPARLFECHSTLEESLCSLLGTNGGMLTASEQLANSN